MSLAERTQLFAFSQQRHGSTKRPFHKLKHTDDSYPSPTSDAVNPKSTLSNYPNVRLRNQIPYYRLPITVRIMTNKIT